MVSTTSDRPTNAHERSRAGPEGCPRIDQSVFESIAAVQAPITVEGFERWFACLATGGRDG